MRNASVVACIVLFAAAGCSQSGPKMARVSGAVSYGGKPVQHAQVAFFPQGIPDSRIAFARTDKAGRFQTATTFRPGDGAVVGTHLVTVTETWPEGIEIPTAPDGQQLPPPKGPWGAKYRDSAGSVLKVDVIADRENHFEFDLSN